MTEISSARSAADRSAADQADPSVEAVRTHGRALGAAVVDLLEGVRAQTLQSRAHGAAIRADSQQVRQALKVSLDHLRSLTAAMHASYDDLYVRARLSEARIERIGAAKVALGWGLILLWVGFYLSILVTAMGAVAGLLMGATWVWTGIVAAVEGLFG